MAGIASAAIIGGLGLAGSVGAGLIGSGGARAGGAQAAAAGQQAYAANNAQGDRNYASSSPFMSAGQGATGIIGSLLGLGTLTGNSNGIGSQFQPDPNAQGNAIANIRNFAGASGAQTPTYNPFNFTPSSAVSDTFSADPSYAWRFGQGVQAQDQSAAAKGTLLSGGQQQALTTYGQGAASQEYGNWYGRLMQQLGYNLGGGLAANQNNFGQQQTIYGDQQGQWNNALSLLTGTANTGAGSAGAYNGAGSGLTANTSNALVGTGNAGAGYTAAGANDVASGVGSGVNNALQAYLLRNAFGQGGGGGASGYVNLSGFPRGGGPQGPSGGAMV